MNISLVPYGQITALVASTLQHIQVCSNLSNGRSSVDDIVRFLLTGRTHLWVIHDAEGIHGIIITEITEYPQKKLLTMQYCSMETGVLEVISEYMHTLMEQFAKDSGCAGVEYIGRAGWRATARKHGYNDSIVMYQKFFEVPQ